MNFDKLHWNIVGDVTLNYGKFLTAVMNFLIMAFVVFILVKALNTAASKLAVKEDAPEEKKPTKICPMCKSEIANEGELVTAGRLASSPESIFIVLRAVLRDVLMICG